MNEDLKKIQDIKRLWMEFDPIGVYSLGSDWPDDEYDAYVLSTLHLLEQGASFDTLKSHISSVVHDMGVDGINESSIDDFVKKLLRNTMTKAAYKNSIKSVLNEQLCNAIGNGDILEIEKLIALGADVNDTSQGCPLLHLAIHRSSFAVVMMLYNAGALLTVKDSRHGNTVLHEAATVSPVLCDFFIRKGLSINEINEAGQTPLMGACKYGQEEVVRVLLDNSADVRLKDYEGNTALHFAAMGQPIFGGNLGERSCNVEIARLLCKQDILLIHEKNGEGQTPFVRACIQGRANAARFLLEQGSLINAKDASGCTPLMHAICQGDINTVWMLLKAGADIHQTNDSGATALHFAAGRNDFFVYLLLEQGALIDARTNDGDTPLMQAVYAGNLSVMKLLLERNCDVAIKDNNGFTALQNALDRGKEKAAQLLMKYGAH